MQEGDERSGSYADGLITGLGGDLPETNGTDFGDDDNDTEIEVKRPPRNKAFAVIDRRSTSSTMLPARKSTGKLTRPTRPEARAPAAPRLLLNAGGQRKLNGPARDPLAFDATPMRPVLAPRAVQPAQFSPTRKRRRQARSVDQPAVEPSINPGSGMAMDEPEQEAGAEDVGGPELEPDTAELEREASAQEPSAKRTRHRRDKEPSLRRYGRLHAQGGAASVEQAAPVPRLKPGPVANRASLYAEGDTVNDVEAKDETPDLAPSVQPKPVIQKQKLVPKIRSNHAGQSSESRRNVESSSMPPVVSRGEDPSNVPGSVQGVELRQRAPKRKAVNVDRAEDVGDDEVRIFDQEAKLNGIYLTLRDIGWSYHDGEKYERADVDLEDPQVKILKKLCRKAKRKLEDALKQRRADESNVIPCVEELMEIEIGLRELHDDQTYHKSRTKMTNVYFYLIPSLLRLLKETIHYYHVTDDLTSTRSSITIPHVRNVVSLMDPIIKLKNTLELYPKPEGLNVAKAVKNGIFLPLIQVRQALQSCLSNHDRRAEQIRQREKDAARYAANERRFAAAEEEAQRKRAAVAEWQHLHLERRLCEFDIDVKKQNHLAVPPLVDIDRNGEPFERVPLFGPRIGPPPSKTRQARLNLWDTHEIAALKAGLREFAGPDVYIKIFRSYCCRHGVLNRFSVTEIVTKTADWAGWTKKRQIKKQGYVDDWLEKIEFWTAPRDFEDGGRGQENRVVADQAD